MRCLSWSPAQVDHSVLVLSGVTQFEFFLSRLQIEELCLGLMEVANQKNLELRLNFIDRSAGWVFFWKQRVMGQSRLLLSHPEKEQWVATIAMDQDHWQKWMGSLQNLKVNERIVLGTFGEVWSKSNLEMVVTCKEDFVPVNIFQSQI